MRSKVTYSKFEVTSSNPSCFYLPKCLLAFLSIPYFFGLLLTITLEHATRVNHYNKCTKSEPIFGARIRTRVRWFEDEFFTSGLL